MEYKLVINRQFQCIGNRCPDNCCRDWKVDVDAECLARWRHLPESDLRGELLNSIREGKADKPTHSTLRKKDNGDCVHLGDDGLCLVQSQLGHEMLPEICRMYPRIREVVRGVTFQTMSISCPEVARLVLHNKGDVVIREPEETDAISAEAPSLNETLHGWTEKVLTNQKYPISLRVTVLAKSLAELAIAAKKNELGFHTVMLVCNEYKKRLAAGEQARKKGLSVDPVTAGSFWSSVFRKIRDPFALGGSDQSPSALLAALRANEYGAIYRQIKKARSHQPLSKYATPLTRYLQASLFNSGFPLAPLQGNYVASFLHGVLPYAMVVLLLRLAEAQGVALEQDKLADACYRVERWIRHDRLFLNNMENNADLLRLDLLYPVFSDL